MLGSILVIYLAGLAYCQEPFCNNRLELEVKELHHRKKCPALKPIQFKVVSKVQDCASICLYENRCWMISVHHLEKKNIECSLFNTTKCAEEKYEETKENVVTYGIRVAVCGDKSPPKKPTTTATKSTTEATKARTEATKSTTEATKASSKATKSTTEATKATSKATKSTTEATKATSKATKATSKATKSTTEATKATTQVKWSPFTTKKTTITSSTIKTKTTSTTAPKTEATTSTATKDLTTAYSITTTTQSTTLIPTITTKSTKTTTASTTEATICGDVKNGESITDVKIKATPYISTDYPCKTLGSPCGTDADDAFAIIQITFSPQYVKKIVLIPAEAPMINITLSYLKNGDLKFFSPNSFNLTECSPFDLKKENITALKIQGDQDNGWKTPSGHKLLFKSIQVFKSTTSMTTTTTALSKTTTTTPMETTTTPTTTMGTTLTTTDLSTTTTECKDDTPEVNGTSITDIWSFQGHPAHKNKTMYPCTPGKACGTEEDESAYIMIPFTKQYVERLVLMPVHAPMTNIQVKYWNGQKWKKFRTVNLSECRILAISVRKKISGLSIEGGEREWNTPVGHRLLFKNIWIFQD